MATVHIKGARELRRKFNLLTGKGRNSKVRQILRKAARPALKPILHEIRQRSPKESGALRRSFTIRALQRSRVAVGARITTREVLFDEEFYGGFQEWGWTAHGTKVPGKRFITKAVDAKKDSTLRIFSDLVNIQITNAIRRG